MPVGRTVLVRVESATGDRDSLIHYRIQACMHACAARMHQQWILPAVMSLLSLLRLTVRQGLDVPSIYKSAVYPLSDMVRVWHVHLSCKCSWGSCLLTKWISRIIRCICFNLRCPFIQVVVFSTLLEYCVVMYVVGLQNMLRHCVLTRVSGFVSLSWLGSAVG